MIQVDQYRRVFGWRGFRLFWIGFTLSVIGDATTRVALTWYVLEKTNSSEALGLLALAYTGPVIVSGLLVGSILDRFDRRQVMIIDNLFRGVLVAAIPILSVLDRLALWHVYGVAFVYGSLIMITLAGSPAIVPDLIDDENLPTANALEQLSYTLSAVIGPLLAGFLIPLIGSPNVVLIDALSYFLFAILLLRMPSVARARTLAANPGTDHGDMPAPAYRVTDAGRLLWRNPVLLSTTLMFMAANVALGALTVWLPILATTTLHGGSELYGTLLGARAAGQFVSSILVGTVHFSLSLGKLIGIAQAFAGLALGILLFSLSIPVAFISMILFGVFTAPLTIWAQTLRMKIIPQQLRGRTFALLRMLMQGSNPAGGMAGGFVLPFLNLPVLIMLSAVFMGVPGLIGLRIRELRKAT